MVKVERRKSFTIITTPKKQTREVSVTKGRRGGGGKTTTFVVPVGETADVREFEKTGGGQGSTRKVDSSGRALTVEEGFFESEFGKKLKESGLKQGVSAGEKGERVNFDKVSVVEVKNRPRFVIRQKRQFGQRTKPLTPREERIQRFEKEKNKLAEEKEPPFQFAVQEKKPVKRGGVVLGSKTQFEVVLSALELARNDLSRFIEEGAGPKQTFIERKISQRSAEPIRYLERSLKESKIFTEEATNPLSKAKGNIDQFLISSELAVRREVSRNPRKIGLELAGFAVGGAGLKVLKLKNIGSVSKITKYVAPVFNAATAGIVGAEVIRQQGASAKGERFGQLALKLGIAAAGLKVGGSLTETVFAEKIGRNAARSVSLDRASLQRVGKRTSGVFRGKAVIGKEKIDISGFVAESANKGKFSAFQKTVLKRKGKSFANVETLSAGKDVRDLRVGLSKSLALTRNTSFGIKTGFVTRFQRKNSDEVIGRSIFLGSIGKATGKQPRFKIGDLPRFGFIGLGRTRTKKVLTISEIGKQQREFFISSSLKAERENALSRERFQKSLLKVTESKKAQLKISRVIEKESLADNRVSRLASDIEANLRSISKSIAKRSFELNQKRLKTPTILIPALLQSDNQRVSNQQRSSQRFINSFLNQQRVSNQQRSSQRFINSFLNQQRVSNQQRSSQRFINLFSGVGNGSSRQITISNRYVPPEISTILPKLPKNRESEKLQKQLESDRKNFEGRFIPSLVGFATQFRLPNVGVPTISPRFLTP